jgi:hypothetical protein
MDVTVDPTVRSDAQLIGEDGETGFAELYRRHVASAYVWFRARLSWAAADLTAETFAQAWISRRRFRDDCDGQVLGILHSGKVSEAGHVTVDGRDALKLASADG